MNTQRRGPSTLVIVVDGLRATDVMKMPFVAELARDGVSYQHARSVAPSLTRPAAATLATGTAPATTGIDGNSIWARGQFIDTSRPDDLELLRRHRGNRLLPVPTLGEHLADHGRSLVAVGTGSNGCTLLLNPAAIEGCGAVIGAWPSGDEAFYAQPDSLRMRLAGCTPAATGGSFPRLDWATDLIVDHVVPELMPDVLLFWSGELDHVQHANGIGGHVADSALLEIDVRLRRLVERTRGDVPQTDVIVTADHGFSNATHTVDLAEVRSQIPQSLSDDIQLVNDCGGLLMYTRDPLPAPDADSVLDAVMSAWWSGPTFAEDGNVEGVLPLSLLHSGSRAVEGLLAYVSLTYEDQRGVLRVGNGTDDGGPGLAGAHGSASRADMQIPLVLNGPSFRTAHRSHLPADLLDIPATICRLMELPIPRSMSGRALTEAIAQGNESEPPNDVQIVARHSADDVTTAHFQEFAGRQYFFSAERHRR